VVYDQSWPRAIWKSLVTFLLYTILLLVGVSLAMFAGLLFG
jgi:hypothetical protein